MAKPPIRDQIGRRTGGKTSNRQIALALAVDDEAYGQLKYPKRFRCGPGYGPPGKAGVRRRARRKARRLARSA